MSPDAAADPGACRRKLRLRHKRLPGKGAGRHHVAAGTRAAAKAQGAARPRHQKRQLRRRQDFPKKRARSITARPSIARSTAKPRRKRPRRCTRKASSFIRCRCCPTIRTDASSVPQKSAAPRRRRPAPCRWLRAASCCWPNMTRDDHLREQHLDQSQRPHARRGGEGEGEKPELRGERAHEAGEQRRLPGAHDRHQGRRRARTPR